MSAISVSKESLQEIRAANDTIAIEKGGPRTVAEESFMKQIPAKLFGAMKWAIPPLLGLLLLVGVWALIAQASPNLPGPAKTWVSAVELFSDPFYDKGPNDQGIGWNILNSLQRVGYRLRHGGIIGYSPGLYDWAL